MKIKKSRLNLTIDIIMFIVMMALAGIGFMIKYMLIPGFKRNQVYGKDVELYFWGLDRHEWGTIHLYVAYFLAFLLVLHLFFHWKQIVCIYKSMFKSRLIRGFILAGIVVSTLLLIIAPLVVKPTVAESETHHSHGGRDVSYLNVPIPVKHENKVIHETHEEHEIDLFGYQTLNEVSKQYGIPVEELAKVINISIDEKDERLGRLRKVKGFELDDLRNYIAKHSKQK